MLIIIPIFSRMLTTEEFGSYSVFQSWKELLTVFATLNLYAGVFTKAMIDYPQDRDRYTSCMQTLGTSITLTVAVIYLVFPELFSQVTGMPNHVMLSLFAYLVFYPSFLFWSVRQRVEYKYVSMVVVSLIISVLTPVVGLLLLFTTNMREYAIIHGYLAVQAIAGLIFYFRAFKRSLCFFYWDYWKFAIKFNVPLIPHYLSLFFLAQADRIMINHYRGAEEAGLYSLAYQVPATMSIVSSAINGSFVPWSYEQIRVKNYHNLRSKTNLLIAGFGMLMLSVILIAPEVILILGSQRYLSSVWVIPTVALGIFYTVSYNAFSTIEFYFSRTYLVMIASLFGSIINLVLNAVFIPLFGFIAAGYTTAASYLLMTIMHGIFARRICERKNIGTYIYSYKAIAALCLLFTILAIAATATYYNTWIRYGIFVILLIVVIINRDRIIAEIK